MSNTFHAQLNRMSQQGELLHTVYMRLGGALGELRAVRRRLTSCEGMEDCERRLAKVQTDLDDELASLGTMTHVLDRVMILYTYAENQVIRECEDIGAAIVQRGWGGNDIGDIRRQLEELELF